MPEIFDLPANILVAPAIAGNTINWEQIFDEKGNVSHLFAESLPPRGGGSKIGPFYIEKAYETGGGEGQNSAVHIVHTLCTAPYRVEFSYFL